MIALGVGGYWFWSRSHAAGKEAAGVVDSDDLRAQVSAAAGGTDVGDAASLLEPDAALTAFAEATARGKDSDEAKLRAVVLAIKARADKQAFVPWSLLEPRETPAMTAAQTFAKLKQDGGRSQLYPLEVAAVAAAALRSIDVPARVIELYTFTGERSPLDPSGRFGYFGVGLVAAEGSQPKAAERVLDVYGGRSAEPKRGDYAAISDKQAVAALLGLRAMHRLAQANDPPSAVSLADAAAKLAPSAANLRGVRAAVLLASGGKDEGTRELEAAAQLQPRSPQRNNLAVFALATGDAERAAKEVARALAETPDYASAHLTLASVHMARSESDLARAELTQAERLDPGLPSLPLAWAELYATTGDLMQAQSKAEEAIRLRPKAPESHLLLARILRQAGRYDEMRSEAQKVLELAPASQRDQVTQVIKAVLGPTALETATGDEEGAAEGGERERDPAMQLREPSHDPGTLQLGSGEPKLRLGDDGDSKLKLELTH